MADATVTLGLNAAQLSTGLKRATSEVDGFARRAKDSFGKIGGGISSMASGLGTAIAGLAVGSKIQSTIEHFSRISDLASRFDVSTDALQRLNFAASMSGTDLETAARALTILNKALDDPANKKATEAFERLGLSIKSLRQADSFQQIQMLSAAFQKAQATGDGFSEIMALLGKSGAELIPMLRLSAEELENFANTDVVSPDQVAQLEEFGDKLDEVNIKVTSGIGQGIVGLAGLWDDIVTGATTTAVYSQTIAEELAKGATAAEAIKNAGAFMNSLYGELDDDKKPKPKPKPEKIIGDQERDTGEAKKNTYDVAKNLRDQAAAAKSILDPYREFLDFLEDAKQKQDDINKKKADEHKTTQAKIENQKEAAQALQDEINLLTVRATGDEKAIRVAEAALAIKERARQIQKELNVDAKTAMEISEKIASLEKKVGSGADTNNDGFVSKREQRKYDLAQKRGQRKADSIKGFSRDEKGLSAFGGLQEFYGMQLEQEMYGRPGVGGRFNYGGYDKAGKSISSADIKERVEFNAKNGFSDNTAKLLAIMEKINITLTDKLTVD